VFIGHFRRSLRREKSRAQSVARHPGYRRGVSSTWCGRCWCCSASSAFASCRGSPRSIPFDFVYYPWSHSLLMTGSGPYSFAIAYQTATGDRAGAMWVGIAVASHWVLDCITHRPDLPLYPGGGERLGLGLWQSLPATFAVEGPDVLRPGSRSTCGPLKPGIASEPSHGGRSSPCSSSFTFQDPGLRRRRAKTRWRSWNRSRWRSSVPGLIGSTGTACPRADGSAVYPVALGSSVAMMMPFFLAPRRLHRAPPR